jgi:hypothetical protein
MIVVSEHAIDQHFKRFGGTPSEGKRVGKANKIRKVVAFGLEIKPKAQMMKLLNNKCVRAKYYLLGGVVAVYADDVVVTVYKYNADKWLNWYNT